MSDVERYRAVLVTRANARLGSFADAEDVAQEAFVQAYFHLNELRDPGTLLPWLRRMTDNFALMRLRNCREEPVAPGDLEYQLRVILKALQRKEITPWQAEKVIMNLGSGVWG